MAAEVAKLASASVRIVNGARIISIANVSEKVLVDVISETSSVLLTGGIIALPTDTIYGIACSVNSLKGIEELYTIKGRVAGKPIAICVADLQDMYKWANITLSQSVLENLFPGQVTAVFTRKEDLNASLNPHTSLIGIRIPNNDFIRQLVRRCQFPIALTSANRSATKSALQIDEFQDIWPSLKVIIDQGRICDPVTPNSRSGSTVVNVSKKGYFNIIRTGSCYDHVVKVLTEQNIIQQM